MPPLTRTTAITATKTLHTIPQLLPHARARAHKLLRLSTSHGRGPGPATIPLNLDALTRLTETEATIRALTRELATHKTRPGMTGWRVAFQHHPDGERIADELATQAAILEHLCDRPPARLYVGPCDNLPGGRPCRTGIYARPTAPVAACPRCGHQVDVQERRDYLIDRAYRMALPVSTIAAALATPEFGRVHVTRKDVYNWAARGRITDRGRDAHGRLLFNLGDVLDVAIARHS